MINVSHYALLRYAACYWFQHYKSIEHEGSAETQDLLYDFFQSQRLRKSLLAWQQVRERQMQLESSFCSHFGASLNRNSLRIKQASDSPPIYEAAISDFRIFSPV